jgi:hypothetical protein
MSDEKSALHQLLVDPETQHQFYLSFKDYLSPLIEIFQSTCRLQLDTSNFTRAGNPSFFCSHHLLFHGKHLLRGIPDISIITDNINALTSTAWECMKTVIEYNELPHVTLKECKPITGAEEYWEKKKSTIILYSILALLFACAVLIYRLTSHSNKNTRLNNSNVESGTVSNHNAATEKTPLVTRTSTR